MQSDDSVLQIATCGAPAADDDELSITFITWTRISVGKSTKCTLATKRWRTDDGDGGGCDGGGGRRRGDAIV